MFFVRFFPSLVGWFMPAIWPAIIAGGASLLGGILGNKANSAQAVRQMDFEERMSNTAHQREVKDLEAAGLNPILSGTGGPGATTPRGASGAQSDVLTPAVTTGLDAWKKRQEVRNLKEQVNATQSQASLLHHQSTAAMHTARQTWHDSWSAAEKRRQEEERAKQAVQDTETRQLELDVRRREQKGLLDQAGNVSSTAMGYKRIIDLIIDTINPLKGFGLGGSKPRR